jgi:methionyl-tRNA formyltransferase
VNVVFMGTSAFAVPTLEALLASSHTVLAVVTQPDRPQGRGQRIAYSPVKQVALSQQVRVLQPRRASNPTLLDELMALAPQVIVVAAYGQLLPAALLAIPPWGCLNVHASLLPKYRGAAPINWALIRGEQKTGVTIMAIDATLDTGPILLQSEVAIDPDDDVATLQARLAQCGAKTFLQALRELQAGTLKAMPQDHSQATYALKLRKEDGIIPWDRGAMELANLIRGVTPWPGAVTVHAGKSLRIWHTTPVSMLAGGTPGKIAKIDQLGAWVETGDGYLVVLEVQPAGGRRMEAAAYARGHGLRAGDLLGPWS